MTFTISEYNPVIADQAIESVVQIYKAVYSQPPYNEPDSKIQAFESSWSSRTKKAGFIFQGARESEGQLVGFAYGWKSIVGDTWHSKLMEALADKGAFWLADCFEFVDLAVLPSHQGYGLGRDLTTQLFDQVKARTSILLTHSTSTKASQMYIRNGWVVLSERFEVSPGLYFSVFGKDLHQNKLS